MDGELAGRLDRSEPATNLTLPARGARACVAVCFRRGGLPWCSVACCLLLLCCKRCWSLQAAVQGLECLLCMFSQCP